MNKTLTPAQQQALHNAGSYRPLMEAVGGKIWDFAEIGLQEYHSAAYLIDLFANHGFAVASGLAGFPTGFVAEYTNGAGPVVAVLCEYDALPALSTVTPGASGHGCGHNLFAAAAVGTACLLRDTMEQCGIGGTLRVYGTPGEENFASKAYYVHHGLFDDVDCSVGLHARDENKVGYTVSSGSLIKNYTFHGKAAHAGNYPWLGCSALDAVEIMNVACNFLREHIRPDARLHYIITKGGDVVNVVPDLAASQYSVRSPSVPYMEEVSHKVDNCAQAAALATGCTVETQFVDKTYNLVLVREYAELAQQYLELVGAPKFSPAEQATAAPFGDGTGLHTTVTPLPAVEDCQGGCTDEGDVSWVLPHTSIHMANIAQGTTIHSLAATGQMNLPAAYTGLVCQVQATAAMLLELLQNPTTLAKIKAAHKAKMGGLSYPKNPDYTLGACFNPNCTGITVAGQTITADFAQIILLPKAYDSSVTFEKNGEVIAALNSSGTVAASQPLQAGDALSIYSTNKGKKQLIGYYNV